MWDCHLSPSLKIRKQNEIVKERDDSHHYHSPLFTASLSQPQLSQSPITATVITVTNHNHRSQPRSSPTPLLCSQLHSPYSLQPTNIQPCETVGWQSTVHNSQNHSPLPMVHNSKTHSPSYERIPEIFFITPPGDVLNYEP